MRCLSVVVTMRHVAKSYRATAKWDGDGWEVVIEGPTGVAGLQARDLADVEPRARKLIAGYTHLAPPEIDLVVEELLPPEAESRLGLAAQLCEDFTTELDGAFAELRAAGMSVFDIERIKHKRLRVPAPLTVSNAEVAEFGLSCHPTAIGLRWSDHGQFLTNKCRACVEATRCEYRDLPADDRNEILYDRVVCDFCDDGHDDPRSPPNQGDDHAHESN